MKEIAVLVLFLTSLAHGAELAAPKLPEELATTALQGAWVSAVVREAPPAGGEVAILRLWNPLYKKTERFPKGVWLLTALVKVTLEQRSAYQLVICTYDLDGNKSALAFDLVVSEEQLPRFMEAPELVPESYSDTTTVISI